MNRSPSLFVALVASALTGSAIPGFGLANDNGPPGCGSYPGRRHQEQALHQFLEKQSPRHSLYRKSRGSTLTAGHIVLMEGDDSFIIEPNRFDLGGTSIRFSPSPDGKSYDVAESPSVFEPSLGRPVTLGDDDSLSLQIPFDFHYSFQ